MARAARVPIDIHERRPGEGRGKLIGRSGIVNYALTLEYLEAQFYERVDRQRSVQR